MKRFLFFTLTLFCCCILNAQILLEENFDDPDFPTDWSQETDASDGGWLIGTAQVLSSQAFPITPNGTRIIATNDDGCNCDKSSERLIGPVMDFTTVVAAVLEVDVFFGGGTYGGVSESATVEVSVDGGLNWTLVEELAGDGGWVTHSIDLSAFAGETSVQFSFHYGDGGGWLYGIGIDNVVVSLPPSLDVELADINGATFGLENTPYALNATIVNKGVTTVSDVEVTLNVNGTPTPALLSNLNLPAFESYSFAFPEEWIPTTVGLYTLELSVTSVNGGTDEVDANNSQSMEVEIFGEVIVPNRIEEFLLAMPVFTTIGNLSNQLNKPTDLDFFPVLGKNELWVINERTEATGGSTVTFYNAGEPDQDADSRVDGNAWHFMSLPTGIAFSSDNGNWASSPGVLDANHGGGTFTGPTLWSSDPDIYAQPSGGNGSHLDMLHGSPYSMGIAHEVDNVFWVFDGFHSEIVRYDFVEDHGPGNDFHGDAIVRRFPEVEVTRDAPAPSHLILDKATGWLYIVDTGKDRVLRLDINSGTSTTSIPLINEQLAEHSDVTGVTWEVIIDSGLERPSGIEIMEDFLLVGDYATGEIVVYDMANNFVELGRIQASEEGLAGIKVGPDGNIWFTNRLKNQVLRMEPGEISSTRDVAILGKLEFAPNPSNGMVRLNWANTQRPMNATVSLIDATGRTLMEALLTEDLLDLSQFGNGMYWLQVSSEEGVYGEKVLLQR